MIYRKNENNILKPELLSPAGTIKNMRYAFAYGADAVYAGQPRYSLRVRNNEFNYENLQIGINEAHALNKKFYVVANIAPHNAKLKTFIQDIKPIIDIGPDALIMSDSGLIMLVREHFPDIDIHLSVQANAVNWATVKFWKQIGLTRVILSRELSLEEIEEIRAQVLDMEIEIFVHGALCMAYSGRCLLSGYINKRDSNQGACTNVCRWKFNIHEGKEDKIGNIIRKFEDNLTTNMKPTLGIGTTTNSVFIIEDTKRPEDYMTAFEDEHGTYIMNSKDLCAIAHIERLAHMGVHSFKIEGRTKSHYYCARTAQAYRKAIDDAVVGKSFDTNLLEMLEGLANRGYTEGFLCRHSHDNYQNYHYGYSVSKRQQFIGDFTGERKGDLAAVSVRNKFTKSDSFELMTQQGNVIFTPGYLENNKGKSIAVAPGDGHTVWLPVPRKTRLEFALLIRILNNESTQFPHKKID